MQSSLAVHWTDHVSGFCMSFVVYELMDINVGRKTDYAKVTEQDCLLGYKRVFNLTKSDAM